MAVSKVILGIGNIGSKYDGTRHNIGFDIIDVMAEGVAVKQVSFVNSTAVEITYGETTVVLMKPNTYVNLSGVAAHEVLNHYDLSAEDMIVVVDDFHLPIGSLRFRKKGSAGGHNGLNSLIEHCGEKFHRLRFGIGPKPEAESIIDFVLGRFTSDELKDVNEIKEITKESLIYYLDNGIIETMNRYNSVKKKNPTSSESLEVLRPEEKMNEKI